MSSVFPEQLLRVGVSGHGCVTRVTATLDTSAQPERHGSASLSSLPVLRCVGSGPVPHVRLIRGSSVVGIESQTLWCQSVLLFV